MSWIPIVENLFGTSSVVSQSNKLYVSFSFLSRLLLFFPIEINFFLLNRNFTALKCLSASDTRRHELTSHLVLMGAKEENFFLEPKVH